MQLDPRFYLRFTVLAVLCACGDDGTNSSLSSTKELTTFTFAVAQNGRLGTDVQLSIAESVVTGSVGYAGSIPLVATFATTGERVEIDGVEQVSGVTPNDFTNGPVTYRVIAEDGSTRDYAVDVTVGRRAQLSYVKGANEYGGFGLAVAASHDGETIAVGAWDRVFVYSHMGTMWKLQGSLRPLNHEIGDRFGLFISLSDDGSTLAVGADSEASAATGVNGNGSDNSAPNSGAAYIFTRTGEAWTQQAYIKASNTSAGDCFANFGLALSGDGNTLAVGAYCEASGSTDPLDNSMPAAGAVYVFQRTQGSWMQQAYLKAPTPTANAMFGVNVSLSRDGTVLAASANGAVGDPKTFVFERSGGAWGPPATVQHPSCTSVIDLSADGTTLVLGAPYENGAYVFAKTANGWTQEGHLMSPNADPNDATGASLAISGDGSVVLLGSWHEASNARGVDGDGTNNSAPDAGAAYTFRRKAGAWSHEAYLKASNTDPGDSFAFNTNSVALSGDGITVVVGAPNEQSVSGDQSDNSANGVGATYVFR